MKKNKKVLDFSKRKFNIFFLFSILFFSLSGNSISKKKNLTRKKYKNLIWFLNEGD